ncbi:hypothetical protein T4D_6660 [Trichinella pseudospiralis]|uniref:Uncharacterized protein n=1 Tax=Trichinella pseudospiralis TaxID=6337 RepID=A0A0V1DN64_TRIPS|nr:hypothetical protein T4D_6660 [Trichinella pseudospiralis]
MHIVGSGIWRETLKRGKNEKCSLTCNMASKLTSEENENLTW